jgi:hypothetical protein
MSDPRYKNGIHKSTFRLGQQTFQDSPLYHGWEPVELKDGRRVWALTGAEFIKMRRATEKDKELGCNYEWLVFVEVEGVAKVHAGYSGSIASFTKDIVQELVTCI